MDINKLECDLKNYIELLREWNVILEAQTKEIRMWRERYLAELPKEVAVNEGTIMWGAFLCAPSVEMNKHSPRKLVDDYRNYSERAKKYEDPKT